MIRSMLLKASLLLFILISHRTYSQDYRVAVGLRFGYGWGVSVKGVVAENGHVLEGLARYGYHGVVFTNPGVNLTALYEKHFMFGRANNWAFLLGGGPGIGFGKSGVTKYYSIGIGPIIGFDVTAQRIPLNFSIDYKPALYYDRAFNVPKFHDRVITYYEVGIGVRYAIK